MSSVRLLLETGEMHMSLRRIGGLGFFFAICFGMVAPARAALISGWATEGGTNGGGTVTDGPGAGAFSTSAPTGNLTPRALLPSTLTLTNLGDQITLSGQVAMAGSLGINGNDSFRFWLLNSNGNPTGTINAGVWTGDTITGWLGYGVEIGNLNATNGTNVISGRLTGNTGGWFSNTGAYTVQSVGNGSHLAAPATYNFNLTLTKVATGVQVAYTFADTGGNVNISNSAIDTGTGNGGVVSTTSFNAAGFLENTSSGGAATYSNVDVTYTPFVPEPAMLSLIAASGCALLSARRRRNV
jgi:hypothetical protein